LSEVKRKGMKNTSEVAGRKISIAEAVREVQAGRMVLICDDESREHEADLCLAAQFATTQAINFEAGIIVERIPLETPPTVDNIRYLQTKHQRLGHLLTSLQRANKTATPYRGKISHDADSYTSTHASFGADDAGYSALSPLAERIKT
jgi:hypothetical protein